MNDIAVIVTHDLKFNMSRLFEIFFKIYGRIPEGRTGFVLRGSHLGNQLIRVADDTHTSATAARRSLDQYRVSDFRRNSFSLFLIRQNSITSRQHRDTRFDHAFACRRFLPHLPDHIWRRTDKGQAAVLANLCEIR